MNTPKYSALEQRINTILKQHGADALISYLDKFDKSFNDKELVLFKKLLDITCQTYNIKNKTSLKSSNMTSEIVNARRIITYILIQHTNLKKITISKLVGINIGTLQKYKRETRHYLSAPNVFKDFNTNYTLIEQRIIKYE